MAIRCKKCGKKRRHKVYVLFPLGDYIHEVMHKAYCRECDTVIVILYSYKRDGSLEKRSIDRVGRFLERRTINYQETNLSNSWRKAKGFRYIKGYRIKNSKTAGVYSLSTDKKEQIYKAKLL